jgi:hypothetical protein
LRIYEPKKSWYAWSKMLDSDPDRTNIQWIRIPDLAGSGSELKARWSGYPLKKLLAQSKVQDRIAKCRIRVCMKAKLYPAWMGGRCEVPPAVTNMPRLPGPGTRNSSTPEWKTTEMLAKLYLLLFLFGSFINVKDPVPYPCWIRKTWATDPGLWSGDRYLVNQWIQIHNIVHWAGNRLDLFRMGIRGNISVPEK